MVKYVIELELELSFRLFRDAKVLEQGEVRIEVPRSTQRVAPDVAESIHHRLCPRSGRLTRVYKANSVRSLEPIPGRLRMPGTSTGLDWANKVRPARPSVA